MVKKMVTSMGNDKRFQVNIGQTVQGNVNIRITGFYKPSFGSK